jgi:hypothetical protein
MATSKTSSMRWSRRTRLTASGMVMAFRLHVRVF